MTDILSLDEGYSTTRLLTKEKPKIINTPEDKFETVFFLPEGENRKGEGGLRTKGYFKKSFDDKPLISIITVVFNGEKYLEETIQSVINQTYENVEYIIIDGDSNDGTVEIIKKYEYMIDYWISEKDNGIYDAMNKGIALCSGELLGIINADDFYYNENIFKEIIDLYNDNFDIYYGNMKIIDQSTKQAMEERFTNINKLYYGMYLNHPATFIKLKTYKAFGYFDSINFRMAADYDIMLRNRINNSKFKYINSFIAYMRDGGESLKNIQLTKKETEEVRKKNLPFLIYHFTKFVKYIRRITK